MGISDDAIGALVYRSCLALDGEDFAAYLALCAPETRYRITNYSPEIRKEVILLNLDRAGLVALFESLPNHLNLPGSLMRHASVYLVERNGKGTAAEVTSSLAVIQTDPEGVSRVYAAGHYHDTVDLTRPNPLITSRTTRLQTRDIGIGTEVPL
jgi:methanesulfonate monooxygenase small subunit